MLITIHNVDVEFAIDHDDFEIQWLVPVEVPIHGRIVKLKKPDKYPKLANLLSGNKLQNLEYIVFYIKKGEQK